LEGFGRVSGTWILRLSKTVGAIRLNGLKVIMQSDWQTSYADGVPDTGKVLKLLILLMTGRRVGSLIGFTRMAGFINGRR
jgi:hypothetical protein